MVSARGHYTHLQNHSTVGTLQKDQRTCSFGLEILLKNTSVREMKEKALRGTKEAFIG